MKIFLGSTFADLFSERQAVEAVIDRMALTYVGMEHFGSFPKEPLQRCLEAVGASDFVILVLGRRYGSLARDQLVSFTEAELREALRLAKPVLAYVSAVSRYPGQSATDSRLEALKMEISTLLGVSQFHSPQDLAWKVAADLHRELRLLPSSEAARQLAHQVSDLVNIFEQRAREIQRTLSSHYEHVRVKEYLDEFGELHAEHLTYLKDGQFVLAHEVLNRIHRISARLQSAEFWARERLREGFPFIQYALVPRPGPLVEAYARDLSLAGVGEVDSRRSPVSAERQYVAALQKQRNEAS